MSKSDDLIKEGYLWFPPHRVLSQLKKSWQKRYCRLFKWSNHGIDRLEVFDGIEDQKSSSIASIIPLVNCVKIGVPDSQKHHQPNVFSVWTKTNVHHFAGNSLQEMSDWICALQTVAFKDNVSNQTIEEDNDLYCSAGNVGVFIVKLIPSEASERCGLKEQSYSLITTHASLELRELDENNTLLLTWPYRFIRKYGYRADRFTFEAGRKCISGEGVFHLEHSNQQEIFKCLSSKMKSMKNLLNGDMGNSSLMPFGDDHLRTPLLSMMARSRSPIILDNESNSFSGSIKPVMPLPTVELPPPLKPKPKIIMSSKKPPTTYINEEPHCHCETDANYEDVLEVNANSVGQNELNSCERPNSSTIVPVLDDNLENYDRLKHFGFISKTAPGYRQIQPIPFTHNNKPCIKTDTVILPARKADDSHYGYGTINKKNPVNENRSNKESSESPKELQYTMVLKPKEV